MTMATRALGKPPAADWRAAFRRSVRRAGPMAGAAGLFGAMIYLGLAQAS
jgi:S-DNA-T family DNA segregation ATPase FtsK/SpoIIIE